MDDHLSVIHQPRPSLLPLAENWKYQRLTSGPVSDKAEKKRGQAIRNSKHATPSLFASLPFGSRGSHGEAHLH
jgi:hypothetical protein